VWPFFLTLSYWIYPGLGMTGVIRMQFLVGLVLLLESRLLE